ncbi:MAG: DUF167 domain-containing protein [SAR202 cluster bacterium]|nr:DUF167 domain-containing protein [SAR202 cluster bacterium]
MQSNRGGQAKPSALVEVRVQPKASRNEVLVDAQGRVKVYTTIAPEGGKANEAVVEVLAERLGLSKSAVGIVRGQTTRNKLVSIKGMDATTAIEKIRASARRSGR